MFEQEKSVWQFSTFYIRLHDNHHLSPCFQRFVFCSLFLFHFTLLSFSIRECFRLCADVFFSLLLPISIRMTNKMKWIWFHFLQMKALKLIEPTLSKIVSFTQFKRTMQIIYNWSLSQTIWSIVVAIYSSVKKSSYKRRWSISISFSNSNT